jgi:alpha-ketoglutarate-dependent 2,4-dichlorophenoxyacetate dioxygenase
MSLKTSPLHPLFGLQIDGISLESVTKKDYYPEIRHLFEKHSVLLFKNQACSEKTHIKFAKLFGPLENRDSMATGEDIEFKVSKVSNKDEKGSVFEAFDLRTLDLQANMLWHTDSTFLPIPALANIIAAKVIPSQGGQTEFASTRAALKELPSHLYEKIVGRGIWHRLSHSRSQIDPDLAKLDRMTKWPDRKWGSIWKNPVNREEAIYIASHAFQIEGMSVRDSETIINELIQFCTKSKYVYSQAWTVGDVLIWDERAILHRGTPWDYSEPRTLASICVSATKKDGLNSVRVE